MASARKGKDTREAMRFMATRLYARLQASHHSVLTPGERAKDVDAIAALLAVVSAEAQAEEREACATTDAPPAKRWATYYDGAAAVRRAIRARAKAPRNAR